MWSVEEATNLCRRACRWLFRLFLRWRARLWSVLTMGRARFRGRWHGPVYLQSDCGSGARIDEHCVGCLSGEDPVVFGIGDDSVERVQLHEVFGEIFVDEFVDDGVGRQTCCAIVRHCARRRLGDAAAHQDG